MTTVGVIKEIKNNENRVALTPEGARTFTKAGHRVLVQQGAGEGSGFADADYQAAGAQSVSKEEAWHSDLILKVKEPLAAEYQYLKQQIVFTYFHLAGVSPDLTKQLLDAGTTAVAYATVKDSQGKLPLLAPMSAVAGNMAVTIGNYYLARPNQGKGILLGNVLSKPYGKVAILGDGVVGRHAASTAIGMGANTVMFSRHKERTSELQSSISDQLRVAPSTPESIAAELRDTDLLIGAVLHPGGRAPHLVTEEMVASMEPGSVIVDVSIDQGGCIKTSRPTSHGDPVFSVHGVTHYCVTNMPGAYPRTSTIALTNATLGHALRLADEGITALRCDTDFSEGVNTYRGYITNHPVAESLDMLSKYKAFEHIEE
jgi:alanine dehydrogenase